MIRKLMRSIREQKRNSILAMVTISGEVVFEVIIPMLMANLIDYGIDAGNMNYIVKMGLVLLLSAAGQLLCGIASGLSTPTLPLVGLIPSFCFRPTLAET